MKEAQAFCASSGQVPRSLVEEKDHAIANLIVARLRRGRSWGLISRCRLLVGWLLVGRSHWLLVGWLLDNRLLVAWLLICRLLDRWLLVSRLWNPRRYRQAGAIKDRRSARRAKDRTRRVGFDANRSVDLSRRFDWQSI